jgi:choline oxidase
MNVAEFDYVVVGGGASGAVLAARLSESADVSVCLVESGPTDKGDDRIEDLRRWEDLFSSELETDYAIEPQLRGNDNLLQLRTRVLGGCYAHNGAISFETPPSDLRRWSAEVGSDRWAPEAVEPLFARIRDRVRFEQCPAENECGQAFVAAATALGHPQRTFGRGEIDAGVGWLQLSSDGHRRENSSICYLHRTPRPERRLEIRTNTLVTRVLLDNQNVARGVETDQGIIRAEREVILCAGSFESPKLLMLSGIGDGADLRRHAIPVRAHLPGVGRHLIDHPEGIVVFEASRPLPLRVRTDWEVALLARSEPEIETPDVMMHLASHKIDMYTVARGYKTAEHVFSINPNVCRARSQGSVRLRDADPRSRPLIDPAYFTDPDDYDLRIMRQGVQIAREISHEAPLRDWIRRELAPGPDIRDGRELDDFIRLTASTVFHPSGTCKMGGELDGDAVVDAELRVRGVRGLRVADTSIFPSMTSINPVVTAMMIGEKCADLLLDSAS